MGFFPALSLPPLTGRTRSTAPVDTGDTRLGRAVAQRVRSHPGKSGIHPLADPRDAFSARVLLARAAERSLDVRYYIWRNDLSGGLLLEALHEAAERGVRVRLLLDDTHTAALDATLAALDAHPNIEVRLFNPFPDRRLRWLGLLTDFFRLNRRMHNKSFTADNRATVIGGRNVGDEYFAATDGVVFADLDVLAIGPVVEETSRDFDRYWASESSYPIGWLVPPADRSRLSALASKASRIERDPSARAYMDALRDSPFVRELLDGTLPLEWAATHLVSDDPAKVLGPVDAGKLLTHQLDRIIGRAASALEIVSPYFVPAKEGFRELAALARNGVKVRVLTNSLEATDLAIVHSGYARWRRPLLEAGIALYELRRLSALPEKQRRGGPFVRSASSLHAKTFSVDRSRIFVGSFNLDPRSAKLNTELGFVIESPALAKAVEDAFDGPIPEEAYEVRLTDKGELYWIERRDGKPLRHDAEPGTSAWKRAAVRFLSLLPIEWLL